MEFKSVVYNAARDGKLHRLRMFLDHRCQKDVSMLTQSKTNGATPLIAACRHGHLAVSEYLVEKCFADVELAGSVTFDGESIDGAPPLWCSAAAGHINIVKYLIKMGAHVNKTTLTNSTPLRAACFDGHFDIVQYLVEHNADIEIANRHGHTCLMISCYKGHYKIVKYLLEKGAEVNRKSLKGNTALHDCAESGSLEIMKLLLSWGAVMEKDSYGMTPLLAAAVTGHTRIVDYLIAQSECTRSQMIDALELLGATFVDKKRDMLGALRYWKIAMEERYNKHMQPVLEKPQSQGCITAYENAVEVRSIRELEELIADPDDMRMQALLVRERILGPAHPDTSYYIRYRGAVYADMGNFERCILLWMYALDMQQQILEPLNPMTQSSLLSFAELFSFMMNDGRHRGTYKVSFKDLYIVFEKAVKELEVGLTQTARTLPQDRDITHFNRLLVIIMHLICLLCRVSKGIKIEEDHNFKKTAYRMVRMNPRGAKGFTPLHLACSKETTAAGRYPVCTFPSAEVVALLIEVGASVNAIDLDHNTPLHIAAMNSPVKSSVIKVLLENGAHIDACNLDHKTPMQMLQRTAIYEIVTPLNYMSLQCLAARSIVNHGIQYKGHIPQKLEAFVSMH